MKKQYLKEFLHRGALFAGLGPVVVAIVHLIVGLATGDTAMTTMGFFQSTMAGYLLAFLVAGSSVFYQVEQWGLAKATLCHLIALYAAYLGAYLFGGWLRADFSTVAIFSAIFAGGYLVIWAVVVLSVKATAQKLNEKMGRK